MEQFEIKRLIPIKLGPLDLSFTNSSLWMLIAVGCAVLLMYNAGAARQMVPGRWQALAETVYEFVDGMVKETVGEAGRKYFPFIFSLFVFIMFCNLLGLIPYGFTVTSHIIVNFSLALFIFVSVTVIGFARHGAHFLSFFVPHGAPAWLLPLMVPIEIISYLVRPISLSVRLFANMVAGHVILKLFAGFVVTLGAVFPLLGAAPLAIMVVFTGFEIFIALLQAYVFTILTCLYLNDAINMAH
jgi:F-type H+-transporting ATPase subunit a